MPVGLKIVNGNNIVIIDANVENYAFVSKGTLTGGTASPQGFASAALTVGVNCIVAFRGNDVCTLNYTKVNNDGTKTFNFYVKGTGQTINYWIFDKTSNAIIDTSIKQGIRIRRPSDGVLVFDSRAKYMKVLDYKIGDLSQAKPTGSYGGLPAIVCIQRAGSSQTIPLTGTGNPTDPQVQYLEFEMMFTINGFTVSADSYNTYGYLYDRASQVPPGLNWAQNKYMYMIIDVTNL